jgi:serine O-acetyltransferase
MNRIIKYDLYRYLGKDFTIFIFLRALRIPGFRYLFFLRKAAASRRGTVRWFLYRMFLRRYTFKYGIQIPHNTQIGEGFFIGHFGNIIINDRAVIGKNCNISPGVTIGQANRGRLLGVPTIGNHVWMGTNSLIVGNIRIGNDVLIAPGAFVNFDVPDHSIVIGNPGKIIKKEFATQGYVENIKAFDS